MSMPIAQFNNYWMFILIQLYVVIVIELIL